MLRTPYTISRLGQISHLWLFLSFPYFTRVVKLCYDWKALSIQDLAKRKFQRLRTESERSEKEIKNEETIAVNSLPKSQIKRPMSRKLQEPVGSDFSSGATLAMPEDVQVGSSLVQASECEKPSSIDRRIDGNMSSVENIIDKGEELQQGIVEMSMHDPLVLRIEK